MEVLVNASAPLTVGSLFSGVGGMDIGLEWSGFQHKFFAEIDPYCREVLKARFPGVPVYEDVKDVDAGAGYVDLLCGGFPCQDLSVAGKRAGLAGERSGLFFEFMRIVDALRPRAVLIENVEGLYSSGSPRGADFGVVLDSLAERGYLATWRTLDAQHFGVPQRRRRVFVCAISDGDPGAERIGEVLAVGEGSGGDSEARDPSWPLTSASVGRGAEGGGGRIVGALSAAAYVKYTDQEFVRQGQLVTGEDLVRTGKNAEVIKRTGDDTYYIEDVERGPMKAGGAGGAPPRSDRLPLITYRKSRRAQSAEDAESWVDDGVANTLNQFDTGDTRTTHVVAAFAPTVASTLQAQVGRGYAMNAETADGQTVCPTEATVRRLTPMECERLMGWPDGWTDVPWNKKDHAPDSRRYAACGNGVVATVAYWIGARLAGVLK
jgi:DNA (cytosine-5)-methyltransferase 1